MLIVFALKEISFHLSAKRYFYDGVLGGQRTGDREYSQYNLIIKLKIKQLKPT